uniref:uncharacterized protein LOC120887573 isoform X5 n=1 Tax=Ictidomys tridecemlineatus TaxID=43179 RepID=UPI001A9E9960|nr:uncharacterized protein LOC120887573 isoform X5 [Ictidomys tridecemlineatus]
MPSHAPSQSPQQQGVRRKLRLQQAQGLHQTRTKCHGHGMSRLPGCVHTCWCACTRGGCLHVLVRVYICTSTGGCARVHPHTCTQTGWLLASSSGALQGTRGPWIPQPPPLQSRASEPPLSWKQPRTQPATCPRGAQWARSCSCPGLEAHQPPAGGASGAKEPGAHPRRELEGPSATPAATRHPSCASDPSLKQKMQEWTGAWLQSDVHSWACFTKAGIGTSMGLWLGKARAGYPASHLAAHGVDTLAGGVDTKPHWEAGRAGCRACCGDRGLCCYPPKAAALWPVWAPGDTSIHDLDQSSHEPNREALPPATFPRSVPIDSFLLDPFLDLLFHTSATSGQQPCLGFPNCPLE